MKRLLILSVFGLFLAAASGCHIVECWKASYCKRSKANCVPAASTPYMVVEDCDPCDPCR